MLAGSVTLTGGPATGLAFAPLFEQAGVAGRVLGRDRGRDRRHRLRRPGRRTGQHGPRSSARTSRRRAAPAARTGEIELVEAEVAKRRSTASTEDDDAWPIIKNLVAILVAMWIGFWVSKGFAALGMTLPAYIGAMLVAAVIRNIDDATGWFGLSHRFINTFGIVVADAVPRHGADDAEALGAGRSRAAAGRILRGAGA